MPVKIIIDAINRGGAIGKISRNVVTKIMESTSKSRSKRFCDDVKGKKILDVGLGTGSMGKLFLDNGFEVTGVDVVNTSLYSHLQPVLYDGKKMPFKNDSFDTGLIVCVLHHCKDQVRVLKEAMRVCKRLIIIEDTFRNNFERKLVAARDSVGNFEFYHHTYRSSTGWEKVFSSLGWKVIKKTEWSSVTFYGMYGRQTLFVIEKK